MQVALTTTSFAKYSKKPLELLEDEGIDYVINPHGRKLSPEETVELVSGCKGMIAGTEDLSAGVLERLPELRVISRLGVGMDNVDLAYCRENDIPVRNTPYGPTRAVAELTVGLIIDLLRDVTRMDRAMRSGTWEKRMGRQLSGKRVGIVGMGRIGRATAGLLAALGCEIAYADPLAQCSEYRCMEIEALLGWADIVTLHCSLSKEHCPVIGGRELSLMREGAWLVNAGRGGLVDEDALYLALDSGRLAGAAVDCFENEPYRGPLAELENVVLTPHIGSYSMESRIQMEIDAANNLIQALCEVREETPNAG
jgi:D-3-phosphoglycerate dehydrogenase